MLVVRVAIFAASLALRAPALRSPRGPIDVRMEDLGEDLAAEALHVQAIVAEVAAARAVSKRKHASPPETEEAAEAPQLPGFGALREVDVDLCLSLHADGCNVRAEADAIFDTIDANGDGKITLEELQQHPAPRLHAQSRSAGGDKLISKR